MRRMLLEKMGELAYRIIDQTRRENSFVPYDNTFTSSNGISLVSASMPETSIYKDTVYVWGEEIEEDSNLLHFNNKQDRDRFLFAVDEYNVKYKGNAPRYLVPEKVCECKSAIMCDICMSNPEEALNF